MRRSKEVAGFDAEFRTLFEARYRSLARYLDRLLGDPDLASDLAQDAFVRLYRRASLPDDPTAWLFSVANNLLRNEVGKQRRRRQLLESNPHDSGLGDPPPRPDRVAEAAESTATVRAALERLPLRDRQLLLLSAEGHSYREIAKLIEVAPGSVGTLLRRARARFLSSVEGPTSGPGPERPG